MSNIITVDLGGTNTRIARFADIHHAEMTGAPLRRRNIHIYKDDLDYITKAARELSSGMPIDALGIGVPGRVSDDKTRMVGSNNLPEWVAHDFCADLSYASGCPVYMENDGVAAGLGEGYFGRQKGDFHYLIWGTGISGVEVKSSNDGDVSALYIRPAYKAHFDAWENDCGGAVLLRKYGKSGEELTSNEWADVNELFARCLREYIALAKPPAIVFGGGLAVHHAETILGHANEMGLPIRISEFGERSGLVGGLALVRRGV